MKTMLVNVFILLAISLFSCNAIQGEKIITNNKPNIIYILADDLGYGEVGYMGQSLIKTPNIDKIARNGIQFSQHYSGSALCAPSRCTLITGKHTGHAHIRNNIKLKFEGNEPILKTEPSVAKVLKEAGYTTGMTGKWGLGYPGSEGDPLNQGFDYFYGYNCQRQAHSYYPTHLWENNQKVMLEGNNIKDGKYYSHNLIANKALDFIKNNKDNPFFLYVPFTIPHTPMQVPDIKPYENEPWSKNQKILAAMITLMDKDIGRIMDLLKELGISDNTLLIFTSDNGPYGGKETMSLFNATDGLHGKKGSLYEGGIRVPFTAMWPNRIQPNTKSDRVSAFWDMLPTFAEIAGTTTPEGVDGISMLPALLGQEDKTKHEFLYWELGSNQAVRMGKWKGLRRNIAKGNMKIELYNLDNDIAESNDVADQNPEIVKQIESILKREHTLPKVEKFRIKNIDK